MMLSKSASRVWGFEGYMEDMPECLRKFCSGIIDRMHHGCDYSYDVTAFQEEVVVLQLSLLPLSCHTTGPDQPVRY